MKWVVICFAVLALLGGAFAIYSNAFANPRVVNTLRAQPRGELARKVMLLTLPSGRELPVNYLREGDTVYAGADGPWWRGLRGAGARVELWIQGESLRGMARAIEDDPARRSDVFLRLRTGVPAWLPSWADAVLVAIELDEAAR